MKKILWMIAFTSACSSPAAHGATPAEPAAKLERTNLEGLNQIVLREDAEASIGVSMAEVEAAPASRVMDVAGEVMVADGRDLILSAPVGGRIAANKNSFPRPGDRVQSGQVLINLVPLATVDRDIRARAQRELDVARADLQLTTARYARAQAMVTERSGSVRAVEEARAGQQVAEAAVTAAEARLRTMAGGSLDADVSFVLRSPIQGIVRSVSVSNGQSVPPSAPLISIAAEGRWIRASFTAGENAALENSSVLRAEARRLGANEGHWLMVSPISGPPSADPLRATIDRYFEIADNDWTPGERVLVRAFASPTNGPTDANQAAVSVPFPSVMRDAEGGAWVYEKTNEHTYRRRRVSVLHREGERMILSRGPAVGTTIVEHGASELWGHELGADQ